MNPTLNIYIFLLCLYLTNFVTMERTISVVAGSNITLYCSLNDSYKLPEWRGPPDYTIYLLAGTEKLNDTVPSVSQNRLRISENNVDLILSHVHKSDSGPYQCQYQDLGVNGFMLVVKNSDEQESDGDLFLIVLIAGIVGAVAWIGICACVVLLPRCCGCRFAILKKLYKHDKRPWPYWKAVILFFVCCCFVGWVYIIVKLIQTRLQGTRENTKSAVKRTNEPLLHTNSKDPPKKKSFKMRQSKFRHVFGQALKKEHCYDNIHITKSSVDSMFCSVNKKYLAVITETLGGGAFMVLPLSKTGRIDKDPPLISGHTKPVLDIKFCPHNDDIIASCSEDCTVKVWKIPEKGLFSNFKEPPDRDLRRHEKRVNFIEWHPTALNLLLSSGSDNKIFLWNCGNGDVVLEVNMPDLCLSCSFSYDGSKFATTCKDTNIRVFDARIGQMLKEGKGHEGVKPSKCAYLKEDKIFTTGFTRMGERQYALWDAKKLDAPMNIQGIDTAHGVLFPLYDPDTSMIWLCGKGDGIIRYYEVTDEPPYVHFLSEYQSNQSQRGIGMMPKRGLNVNICEIARFYKLLNTGLCEVIAFTVPRKSDFYQEDLYPNTASGEATLSVEEFMKGKKRCDPKLMSLQNSYVPPKKENSSSCGKPNALNTPRKQAQRHEPADTGEVAAEVTSPSHSDSIHYASTKVPSKINASLHVPAESET